MADEWFKDKRGLSEEEAKALREKLEQQFKSGEHRDLRLVTCKV